MYLSESEGDKSKKKDVPAHWLEAIENDPEIMMRLQEIQAPVSLLNETLSKITKDLSLPGLSATATATATATALINAKHAAVFSRISEQMMRYNSMFESLKHTSMMGHLATASEMMKKYDADLKQFEQEPAVDIIRSEKPQTISVDSALIEEIAKLREENEELKRYIELLQSKKKKSDYIG